VSAWLHRRESVVVQTPGRGMLDLTGRVHEIVARSGVHEGLCSVFVHHTSASLILCENADPQVRRDLEAFAARLVPDGDRLFEHVDEGDDDMPAHVRTVLTHSSLTVPIAEGRCDLGTWQGVYLWEHRHAAHRRRLSITVMGTGPAR
jgi:secondary thiamine-phosphate synthase enzyme